MGLMRAPATEITEAIERIVKQNQPKYLGELHKKYTEAVVICNISFTF